MNAQAHNEVVSQGPVAVIFRRDAAGNRVAFLQQELDLSVEGGAISIWHEGKGKETQTVPLTYYHATTKLSDVDELDMANKFAAGFQPTFGIALRKRLGKDLSKHSSLPKSANDSLRRSDDKTSEPVQTEMDLKMKALETALTVGISTAIAAVFKEFNFQSAAK